MAFLTFFAALASAVVVLLICDRLDNGQLMPGFRECPHCSIPVPEKQRICPHCRKGLGGL